MNWVTFLKMKFGMTDEFDVSDVEENTLSILSRYVDDADFEDSVLNKEEIKTLMSEIYMEACEV